MAIFPPVHACARRSAHVPVHGAKNVRFAVRGLFAGAAFAAALVAAPAIAGPQDDFRALLAEHFDWVLRENPGFARSVGVDIDPIAVGDVSLAAEDRRAAAEAVFLKRLDAIPDAGLTPIQRTDKAILRRLLSESIEANSFGQRTILFTSYSNPWQGAAGQGERTAFRRKADYGHYLDRLDQFPKTNDTLIAITAKAVKGGYVQPCVSLVGFEQTITGVIQQDPTKSRFYAPFNRKKPVDATDAEWAALQARARKTVTEVINPAYAKAAAFYRTSYEPKCARAVGVSTQPDGARYYAFRIRQLTTTDFSAEQIHKIGLDEVARIRAEMVEVAKKAGFATREAFVQELRTNPKYYAKTPEELMAAAAVHSKEIDGKMPGFFNRMARLPYGLKRIPAETAEGTTTAYYGPGNPELGLAGHYYVNTSKLDQRPLYELPALTAHEAVPGHHHQIALQQELETSKFRRYLANFTAFTEGWGLYSERIGIEMGIYDTPEKEMGRLSYEMWRACRLVVDTGIHAKGWTKEQAVQFMLDNTALSAANIDAEVNRYISWPGQALGYKLGEIKIRELRARAEKALGVEFDLKRFHDAVLEQGAVPLDVLDAQIDAFIAAEKARVKKAG
ncbi:DUF885 domain-containing protein [Sphingomonas sp. J344]|uniref:DUF885 domain-containing protein n=1 Tax=Sphingomonas sp. J344 TaxID=2898434 RepID=UPI00215093DD|nr:DUF885 domain-containing protein [Sphingomonas sp. J344]MCR5871372.1 DUF885 domain-containing protein [Sphingomonas sp. J344]